MSSPLSPHRLLRLQDRRRRRRRRDAGRGVLQPPLLDLSLVALLKVGRIPPENRLNFLMTLDLSGSFKKINDL